MTATIKLNNTKNGIEVYFKNKPERSVIDNLKNNGFRWSNAKKMWYAKQNEQRLKFANTLSSGEVITQIYDLWAFTQIDKIEDNYSKYKLYDNKKIASITRKHLKERFPMCKWSVRSDYNSIHCELKSSPWGKRSDEILAILNYAKAFVNSYNYDNSDIMTDYFDVNFYGFVERYYDYEINNTYPDTQKISELFQQNKQAFEVAEQERKAKEFEEWQIKQAESERLEKIRQENHTIIEEKAVICDDVNYFIDDAKACNVNKQDSVEEVVRGCVEFGTYRERCKITREVRFDSATYHMFANQLLDDYSFFEGMGGSTTDDERVNSIEDLDKMVPEERETVKWYCVNCVAIYCEDELKLVIDPQGYSYARYTFIVDDITRKES